MNWLGLAALLLVQAWISWTLLGAAGRVAPATSRWTARAAACLLFAAVMFLATGLTFYSVAWRSGLLGPVSTLLAAAARAYLVVATVAAAVYAVRGAIRKRLDVDTAPASPARAQPGRQPADGRPLRRAGLWLAGGAHRFPRARARRPPAGAAAPDLDGLRILQLSDIHLSPFLSERELARVIDIAAGLGPHLAVITGDLISCPATRWTPASASLRASGPRPACSAAWAITSVTRDLRRLRQAPPRTVGSASCAVRPAPPLRRCHC